MTKQALLIKIRTTCGGSLLPAEGAGLPKLNGQMLYFSLFLAGFTLGVFAALKLFAPEKQEETWDPQHFPASDKVQVGSSKQLVINSPLSVKKGKLAKT